MACLEIACFNAGSALIAQHSGADRIEFCAGYESGGTTPDFEALSGIRPQVSIPVFVMIRPRSGNFTYSGAEFDRMRSDIERSRPFADGFVFGILTNDGNVDIQKNSELVKLASLPCTFHRAFDEIADRDSALEDVIRCGFQNILTSGGSGNATDNIESLAELVRKAGARVAIMPGGGVRSSNIGKLLHTTAAWFHSAAMTGNSLTADASEIEKIKEKLL